MTMEEAKTKTIRSIEERMEGLDSDSLRYHILENARNFKRSWIGLGRSLYTAWKDKSYKDWGYMNFDVYVGKEIGIRKQTAMKLLKSYYFLEKEEPQYLKDDYAQGDKPVAIPSYESVDVLRRAKDRKILEEDYNSLKKDIFEKGRDAKDLKKSLGVIIRQREELSEEESYGRKKSSLLKRILGQLRSLKQEAALLKMLPMTLISDIETLIKRLEEAMSD
ncbi:MAG: hypothetical protein WC572_05045 [Candidatus Omnitrophota bacterium]